VAIIPDHVINFLATIDVNAEAMPSLSLLQDCKMALICQNAFGSVAFSNSNYKAILPVLDLLVADGGRLVIACDNHRFIKEKVRAEGYFSDSFKLPIESIVPDGCEKAKLSTERQRAIHNALVSNVIHPRRYRILGLIFAVVVVVFAIICLSISLSGALGYILIFMFSLFSCASVYCSRLGNRISERANKVSGRRKRVIWENSIVSLLYLILIGAWFLW